MESLDTLIAPRIDRLQPAAAMPGAEVELHGVHLGPTADAPPSVEVGGLSAEVLMSRSDRLAFRVPDEAATSMVEVRRADGSAGAAPLRVARLLSEDLHPVTSPAISRSGMVYVTFSGQRGKPTPVSVVRVSPEGFGTPFVSGILNATGLAFNDDDQLFVSSRAEGAVYLVDPFGESTVYAEGMGVATGVAFDGDGNLFVGDRSGTLFKIDPQRRIFVHATLEPSVSAYHLAVDAEGTVYVSGPTLNSADSIWAIARDGQKRLFYRGLGRPQGLALDSSNNLYVCAWLKGRAGLVRITQQGRADLVLAGKNLVGVAHSPLGTTVLTTRDAVHAVDLGIEALTI